MKCLSYGLSYGLMGLLWSYGYLMSFLESPWRRMLMTLVTPLVRRPRTSGSSSTVCTPGLTPKLSRKRPREERARRGISASLSFLYFLVLHFLAVYGCLMYLLASMSEELYSVLDIVSVQIFLCVLLLCVFLWGRGSQMWIGSRLPSSRSVPNGTCGTDCQCARQAIRFKSWSYGLLPILWSLMCIFSFWWHSCSYVHLLILIACSTIHVCRQ